MDDLDDYTNQDFDDTISEWQRNDLYKLIENSTLTDEQKEIYHLFIDRKITFNEAECLRQELKDVQLDSINMARAGKLMRIDLNKALLRLIKMDNN